MCKEHGLYLGSNPGASTKVPVTLGVSLNLIGASSGLPTLERGCKTSFVGVGLVQSHGALCSL